MKTPAFWYTPPGHFSRLLAPLGWGYGKGVELLRRWKGAKRFPIPIISVGGLTCGGSGKTPAALAVAKLLQKKGLNIHFVTRGYKGDLQGPVKVIPSLHTVQEVGDEPLLLAQQATTWVSKKRELGIQEAIRYQADAIILDDGHQTLGIYKDFSFVVVDSLQGFGNGCVLPSGPLRENLEEGLKRADAFIGVGKEIFKELRPLVKAHLVVEKQKFPHKNVVAFCGLGFPQKFYRTLEESGFRIIATYSFPDHHMFTEKDLLPLENEALSHQACLVTTRKDWFRLTPPWREKVQVLDIHLKFEDEEQLYDLILAKILGYLTKGL